MTTARAGRSPGGRHAAASLADILRADIRAGEILPGRYLPSERELSRERGIAKMTVRRALKLLEQEGLVSAEPRQGYRVLEPAPAPGKGVPVAFVVAPHEADRFASLNSHRLMLSEFQRGAARRGWALLAVGSEKFNYDDVMEQLESGRIRGALLGSCDGLMLKRAAKAGVPALTVEFWQEGSGVDSVVQDGFGGGLLAASHLLSRGHQRFGWLGLDVRDGNNLVVDRYSGALGGLARKGMSFSREAAGLNTEDDMERAARELLTGSDRPTAIFALWQSATAGLARAARDMGLTPGRDFDLVGWANEENYEMSFKNLFEPGDLPAAIVWRVSHMAETALGRLEERWTRPDLPAIQLRIPTRLIPGSDEAS